MQSNTIWTEELDRLASIINKLPLEKVTKWGADVYTYNGKNVMSYGGFKNHFVLWFFNGVFMTDSHNVLVNAQEGKTKSARQWRFTSINEIDEKLIIAYINEAIEIEKKGLKIQPERFIAIPVAEELEKEFKTNKTLKVAFEKLTPGKQKEYSVYINEAKQEATKLKRVEKIKPMILQGMGLNDKYK